MSIAASIKFLPFFIVSKAIFIDFLIFKTKYYKEQPLVFEGFFEIQTSLENFLDIISPWYGYLKCSTRVGEHVEQKIRAVRHLNQKLWTKTKKCRQKKSYEVWYCNMFWTERIRRTVLLLIERVRRPPLLWMARV